MPNCRGRWDDMLVMLAEVMGCQTMEEPRHHRRIHEALDSVCYKQPFVEDDSGGDAACAHGPTIYYLQSVQWADMFSNPPIPVQNNVRCTDHLIVMAAHSRSSVSLSDFHCTHV